MLTTAAELVIAPLLVGGATLATRRFGERIGGLLSAFPAIVGPVLLIEAEANGREFASRAAVGTLLGLASLGAFCVVYGRLARPSSWRLALGVAWAVTALIAVPISRLHVSASVALVLALSAFGLSHRLLGQPALPRSSGTGGSPDRLIVRMGSTLALVAGLATLAPLVGPVAAGVLTSLPVLASVLVVGTHRTTGPDGARRLLRGLLSGLVGFAVFCWLVAVLLDPLGLAGAFAAATGGALVAQAAAALRGARRASSDERADTDPMVRAHVRQAGVAERVSSA